MKVFVTGATGFVGSAVVDQLLAAGHQVLGLARSDKSAGLLLTKRAGVVRGDLNDLPSLQRGVETSDAIIHTGFVHDFSRYAQCCDIDRNAIEAMGEVLAGSDRLLIVTSGIPMHLPGQIVCEADTAPSASAEYPRQSEASTIALAERGINTAVIRLPPSVHGKGDHGFVPTLIDIARQKGISAYFAEREAHWPAVHRDDAARLYMRALDHGQADGPYQAVAEQAIPFRAIAEAIGTLLGIPTVALTEEEAQSHFSWFQMFAGMDCKASSEHTRSLLDWQPQEPGLLSDIMHAEYDGGPSGLDFDMAKD